MAIRPWKFESSPGHHCFMYTTDMSAFYVLTGQVTYRMTYIQSPHIRVRSGIYHFVRRVPADLQQHYRSDRVSISLRTKSSSAAINKWLKPRVPAGCVVHRFRHSLRHRRRRVECTSDIADAIGGWATAGIGQRYGSGYGLEVNARWMERIVFC